MELRNNSIKNHRSIKRLTSHHKRSTQVEKSRELDENKDENKGKEDINNLSFKFSLNDSIDVENVKNLYKEVIIIKGLSKTSLKKKSYKLYDIVDIQNTFKAIATFYKKEKFKLLN